ncbi:MAG: lysine--tRNA ligase [Candidatus Micrarchaeia archaeon]
MEEKRKEELENLHWSQIIAQKIVDSKKPPFVITCGMTTSGPAHIGTLCEFVYPSTIKKALEEMGYSAKVIFIADILDAFDSVPFVLKEYEKELSPQLGKPLSEVKDPFGCHDSFGEHFLSEVIEAIEKLGEDVKIERANELYKRGAFDKFARIFLKEEEKTKEIIASTSGKKLESLKDWSPILPICENCGKIATTRVIWHDDENYEYVCDKDVGYTKGCGYHGFGKISQHNYKLQWRLHWPSWQSYFNTSAEGGGVDHFTQGGSWDTAVEIHKKILKEEPPVGYKYGFFLFKGKKFSKSKGIGMSAKQLLKLLPPEVVKYILVEPDIQENKNFDPSGEKLIYVYNELERISKLEKPTNRAEKKKLMAFRLSVKKLNWKASFGEILLHYQIYKDWEKVGLKLNDKEGVAYLAPYIEEWIKEGYAPQRYSFSVKPTKVEELKDYVAEFESKLQENMKDVDVHNLVYRIAKENNISAEKLFKVLYRAIIGKEDGPRFGRLVLAIGIDETKRILKESLN